MTAHRIIYDRKHHAAVRTSEYLFNQLIPYIGNKRKLLKLIHRAIQQTSQEEGTFVDFFAGSGVVSRMAKLLGYRVICQRLGAVCPGYQPMLHRLQPAAGLYGARRIRTGHRHAQRPAAQGRLGH